MELGPHNEINAIGVLEGKILPLFKPGVTYYEEGCYPIDAHFRIVGLVGSCRVNNKLMSYSIYKNTIVLRLVPHILLYVILLVFIIIRKE